MTKTPGGLTFTFVDEWKDRKRAMLGMIECEYLHAASKFPPFHSAHEGWAIVKEELDELWEVVREKQSTPGRNERLAHEATQVAAMALRFLIDLPGLKN